MFAAVSFVIGLWLGVGVLALFPRTGSAGLPGSDTKTLGWLILVFGTGAQLAFSRVMEVGSRAVSWMTEGGWGSGYAALGYLSIALAFAAVVAGVGNLRRGEGGWPTITGLFSGSITAAFWLFIALGRLPR